MRNHGWNAFFKLSLIVLFASLVANISFAGERASSKAASLEQRAAGLVAKCSSGSTEVGVCAMDLKSERILFAIDENRLLVPASNQKIISSALALAQLGGDYKFTTKVYRLGADIVLVGDYDPTLGDPVLAADAKQDIYAELDKWAAAVKEKVGAKLDGSILVCAGDDASYRHPDWPRDQWMHWYAAPVAPLNFNNNCFDVQFKVNKGAVEATVSPSGSFIAVDNQVTAGKNAWALKTTEGGVVLSGTVDRSSGKPINVAVNNPPMLLARAFAGRLAKVGVEFGGKFGQVAKLDDGATLIASTQTPLSVVMARANKHSQNMVAECMFLRSCGDWVQGPKKAAEILTKTYGLSPEGFHIADGGGLSHKNGISPGTMVKLLSGIANRKDAGVFFDSLPIAGVEGTLEKRMTAEPYKGRVLGKTGYVDGVSCLSGYVLDEQKKPVIAFSVMVNHIAGTYEAKKLEDSIAELLVDSLGKKE